MFCRSLRQLVSPRLFVGASLAAFLFVLALAPPAVLAGEGDNPGRPPEILSWRHQVLEPAAYQKLAGQWEAFVTANPKDASALVEWGDALRYSGKREEANEKYRQAFETDSLSAAAVEAYASSVVMNADDASGWRTAHERLRRSLEHDPSYAQTCYMLWSSSIRSGDEVLAGRCLRAMVETGDMPRPLLDYGGNMLEGAPQNAIVLTNGDNDTYPPLAYQFLTKRRPDVTIANLSLLNTIWYIRYLKAKGLPITLTDGEIEALRPVSMERLVADQVVEHLFANLGKGGGRSLWYGVTVPRDRRRLATGECLGLLVPVTGGPVSDTAIKNADTGQEPPCDWDRTRDLLDTVYRTEGAIDPLVDWKRESAVARLVRNYVALDCGVGGWLVSSGKKDEAGTYYARAVRLLAFQQDRDGAQQILDDWAKADSHARLLPEATKLLEK
jgi:tetratricopeptide (TPR) repeat protein